MTPLSQLTIIAIDPGAHGALCFIPPRGLPVVHKTDKTPPLEAITDAVCHVDTKDCVAYLEKIGGFIAGKSLPGSSMFKMGHSAGYWEGLLAALHIRTILVRPQDWQAGISGTTGKKGPERKRALRAEALRRYPAIKVSLDDCDALLIADYGVRAEKGARA
jgi:hypothetical protein